MLNVDKACIIVKLYESRKSQETVAGILGISNHHVAEITKMRGYYHTVADLKALMVNENEVGFLAKYPSNAFEKYEYLLN
jgi:hypothetical protein